MANRDASVYLSGLFHESGESVEMVSRNIAAGLDWASPAECTFNLSDGE